MAVVVLPLEISSSPGCPDEETILYELEPAAPLPVVDFSISVKSKMLSRRQLDVFDSAMRRYRKPLVLGYAVGVALYPFMFAVPFDMSQAVAVCVTLLCAVPTISMFSTLRYNMVKLMWATFDFWFCTVAVWGTAIVLCAIVAEAPVRVLAIAVAFAGVQANVMIDANLRSARNWVWVNCIGLTAYVFITTWCSFKLIPRQRSFVVLRVGDIHVPSESLVGSGLMTVCALLARNILRKHRAKKRNHSAMIEEAEHHAAFETIECASYRTVLRYVLHGVTVANQLSLGNMVVPFAPSSHFREVGGHRIASNHVYMQQLQHPNIFESVDPKATILERLLRKFVISSSTLQFKRRSCLWQSMYHVFGVSIAAMAFASGVLGSCSSLEKTNDHKRTRIVSGLQIALLVATIVYCAPFFTVYQRLILMKILKSFNFLFLDIQITLAHVCVCDFLRWSSHGVALVMISWIWNHWVLCVDAVTPLARDRLGFHIRFAAPIFMLCLGAAIGIAYALVMTQVHSSRPSVLFDRVVWSGVVFGQTVSFRVVPVFYNCLINVLPLALRLLWRLFTVSNDVLVVLDGAVVYNNYMSKMNARSSSRERSRRWGSIRTERIQLPGGRERAGLFGLAPPAHTQ